MLCLWIISCGLFSHPTEQPISSMTTFPPMPSVIPPVMFRVNGNQPVNLWLLSVMRIHVCTERPPSCYQEASKPAEFCYALPQCRTWSGSCLSLCHQFLRNFESCTMLWNCWRHHQCLSFLRVASKILALTQTSKARDKGSTSIKSSTLRYWKKKKKPLFVCLGLAT